MTENLDGRWMPESNRERLGANQVSRANVYLVRDDTLSSGDFIIKDPTTGEIEFVCSLNSGPATFAERVEIFGKNGQKS